MTMVSAFGLIGIAASLARKGYLLPAWIVLTFVLERRNAPNVAILPLCMLGASAVATIILPAIDQGFRKETESSKNSGLGVPGFLFLLFISFYSLGSMAYANTQLARRTLSPADREAFAWIRENTPPGSRFVVLTGEQDLFADAVTEWFPILTGRTSLTTLQGAEWNETRVFAQRILQIQGMQACLRGINLIACLDRLRLLPQLHYQFLYISSCPQNDDRCFGSMISEGDSSTTQLNQPAEYRLIYHLDHVSIFEAPH
jgi:hypothetical protein